MARTVLTRELIENLDPEILAKNGVTKQDLLNDLIDFNIMLDHTYGGTIRWYKRPFLERMQNSLSEYRLTKKDAATILAAVGIVAGLWLGGQKALYRISDTSKGQDMQVGINELLAKGEYDTCNAFLSDAMIKLDEYTKTTDGTQRSYYLGMVEEMQSLRAEVNRAYREYEEREALGVDSSAALIAYQDAFKDFVEKASSIGIHYVPVEQTLEEGPKLS